MLSTDPVRTDYYFPSRGAGMIHVCRWTPQGNIRAVVQIVHGIGEYVERYDELAQYLCTQGMLVVAEDHMGHGKSIGGEGAPGYFHGGWFAAVDDTYYLLRQTMEEFPGVPYVLFGHSMGSFMTRTLLCRYPDSGIAAVILSGTGWQSQAAVLLGKALSRMVCALTDERKQSRFLQTVCFALYNAKIPNPKTKMDWLTRDEAVVAAYCADPLCGYTIASGGLLRDMLDGIGYIEKRDNLKRMNRQLPVLLIAGEADPVGDYGKAVSHTARVFRQCGMENVTCKLYPDCRHELHNEPNKAQILSDMLDWLVPQLG